MKVLMLVLSLLASGAALAADVPPTNSNHRYVIERTFPKGALDGLDATAKVKVNQTNAGFGVHWLMSYANADKTKTFCIYEGPNEDAIRKAATANNIPVDSITEVPVTLEPN